MRRKATHVSTDLNDPNARPALVLTDAALVAIDSDDAPTLTLTAAARQALDDEGKQATADVLLHMLKRYPGLQLHLAEAFKQAYQALNDYETAVGLNNVRETSRVFSEACEAIFFQLKSMFDQAVR